MKKTIILFGSIGLLVCMLLGIANAAPSDILIRTDIRGDGIVDRSLLLQTDSNYEGKKYIETMYTPSLGLHGISAINYTEEINMMLCNDSLIDVMGEGAIINIKSGSQLKNYDMGASQSHRVVGDYILDYNYVADDYLTFQMLVGSVDGEGKICNVVRCPINKTYYLRDKIDFEGRFDIDSETEISDTAYPASEIDWLVCP